MSHGASDGHCHLSVHSLSNFLARLSDRRKLLCKTLKQAHGVVGTGALGRRVVETIRFANHHDGIELLLAS